jgi:iron complex transport system permease protein
MTLSRWLMLLGVLAIAAFVAIAVGTISVPLSAVVDALRGMTDSTPAMVVRTLRLPRVALAVLVGAGLGMSGAALQGTMRNPLAEPYLLGVSGGAAVGAVIATTLGLGASIVPLAAFAGARRGGRCVRRRSRRRFARRSACCSWPESSSEHSPTRRSW